jgi:hypothetical protein
VSYSAPLFYPDWHLGPLLYMKRIKTAVFYDFMMAFDHPANTNYQSCGLDLSVDFHVFRWFVPFEAGLRTIFLPDESRWEFEFLYSVNIGDLY